MQTFNSILAEKIYKFSEPIKSRKIRFKDLDENNQNIYESIAESFENCFDEKSNGIYADSIYKIALDLNNTFKSQWNFMANMNEDQLEYYEKIIAMGIKILRDNKVISPALYDAKKEKKEYSLQNFKNMKNIDGTKLYDENYSFNILEENVMRKLEDEFISKHSKNFGKTPEKEF